MRRKYRQLVAAIEKKVGPFTGGDVLVLRGVTFGDSAQSTGDLLLDALTEVAKARGLVGSDLACEHLPLIITLHEDHGSIELLNEDDMRAAGWIRAERVFGAP